MVVLLWIYLARQWPVDLFGQFSLVFAWTAVYGLVAELGLDFWVTQQTALSRLNEGAYTQTLVKFKLWSALLLGLVFYGVGRAFNYPPIALFLFLFGAFILNVSHFFSCYLRGIEKLSIEAILSIIRNVSFVLLAAIGVSFGMDLVWTGCCYLASNCIYGFLTSRALVNSRFKIVPSVGHVKPILLKTLPVWISTLLAGLSIKLDFIVLGEMANSSSVAQYSTAARMFEGCLLLATAFVLTLFPLMARKSSEKSGRYCKFIFNHCLFLSVISVSSALFAAIIGGYLFSSLFGDNYQHSARVFVILMMIFPLSVLVIFFYNALVIAGKTKLVIVILSFAVIFNLIMDVCLIPLLNIDGVLVAFISKELLLLLGFSFALYQYRRVL